MIKFDDIKARVGIDDVALSLGYQLDKRAGLGRYIELVLSDQNGMPADRLVIKNPTDKANQTFFRRSGGGGDVVSFVKENINSFNAQGTTDWQKTLNVLSKFANMPMQERPSSQYLYDAGYKGERQFDISRYDVRTAQQNYSTTERVFVQRGITPETIKDFSAHIHSIKDKTLEKYPYYNVGFPYTLPGNDTPVGYEIRGYGGFKSKAAGSDSTNADWIADLSKSKSPQDIKNVFFFESAYDAMSFYQANKQKLDKDTSVFVSTGGTFSEQQTIFQRMFGVKTVAVMSTDRSEPILLLYGIPAKMNVVGYIRNKVEQCKTKNRIYEITNTN